MDALAALKKLTDSHSFLRKRIANDQKSRKSSKNALFDGYSPFSQQRANTNQLEV